jgi:tRNA-dihydrouridine synthase A
MTQRCVRPLSIAPMMQVTDRHYRNLMRLITRHTLLYTEMITSWALEHGDADKMLAYAETEHPVALQLGGNDPEALARCAKRAEDLGYDEVNLNVGCPSPRVSSGSFGASLMYDKELVAKIVSSMREAVDIPVTVKHRTGVDKQDSFEELLAFVDVVAAAGCERFIVHARKAWLDGLSPKENRTVPTLSHDIVYRLKKERPELCIETNGVIQSLSDVKKHLEHVDGAMIGRAAGDNPWLFANADTEIFGAVSNPTARRIDVVTAWLPYIESQISAGVRMHHVTKHLLPIFHGVPNARLWRRSLGAASIGRSATIDDVIEAARLVAPELAIE